MAGGGEVRRIDASSWKPVPRRPTDGGVNSLSVAADGMVALAVHAFERSYVEIRDADDAPLATIPTAINVRVAWSPASDLLVARVEATGDEPDEGLAFLDPRSKTLSPSPRAGTTPWSRRFRPTATRRWCSAASATTTRATRTASCA